MQTCYFTLVAVLICSLYVPVSAQETNLSSITKLKAVSAFKFNGSYAYLSKNKKINIDDNHVISAPIFISPAHVSIHQINQNPS